MNSFVMKQWKFKRECHCREVDMIYMIIDTSTESLVSFFHAFLPVMNKKYIYFIYNCLIYTYVYTHRVFSCLYSSQSQSFLFADRSTLGSKGHILRHSKSLPHLSNSSHLLGVSSSLPQWTSVFLSLFQIQSTFWVQDDILNGNYCFKGL